MPTNRIFLIEDDRALREEIRALAESWGYALQCAEDLRDPMPELLAFDPQLVLIDLYLPFQNGYHWCRKLRETSRLPILFLSSASDNLNIVTAMELGADDFLSKPFDGSVLMAKIAALLRRAYDFASAAPALSHRGATLNTGDNTLSYQGESIALSKNEYRILLTLLQSRGQVVSREKLMEALWATDSFVDENTLSVNVNRLRRKLDGAGLKDFIATQFGVGYVVR